MRKPRTLRAVTMTAAAALVLTACGGNPTASDSGSDKADSGPTKAEQLYEEIRALPAQERRDKLVELAAEEDGLNIYTSMNADIIDEVAGAFEDEFDIEPSIYRAG